LTQFYPQIDQMDDNNQTFLFLVDKKTQCFIVVPSMEKQPNWQESLVSVGLKLSIGYPFT